MIKIREHTRKIKSKPKKFMAYWNPKFFDGLQNRIVGMSFFTKSKGYSKEDINEIKNLGDGKTWISDDYGTSHIVVRID